MNSKFDDALQSALDAHDLIESALLEIQSVVDAAGESVARATGNLATIRVGSRRKLDATFNIFAPGIQTLEILSTQKSADIKSVHFCDFLPDERGYPVTIRYGTKQLTAFDKDSLEVAMVEVLSSPTVGSLMRMHLGSKIPD